MLPLFRDLEVRAGAVRGWIAHNKLVFLVEWELHSKNYADDFPLVRI